MDQSERQTATSRRRAGLAWVLGLLLLASGCTSTAFRRGPTRSLPAPPSRTATTANAPRIPDPGRVTRASLAAPSEGGVRRAVAQEEDDDEDDDEEEGAMAPAPSGGRPRLLSEGRNPRLAPSATLPKADEDDEEEDAEDNEDGYAHPDLLMKAIGREDSPLRIYGWVEGGIQFNPANPRDGQNLPNTTTNQANQWQFRQVYTVFEKAIKHDDSFDLGFRVDNLFGTDWELFHDEGLSNHTLRTGGYGYSPSQAFLDMHFPILTEGGVDVRLGRFMSLAGYESALAPGRPLMSTGYLYNYSHPFSHIGALFTWNVTDRFQLYNAPVNGWDRWLDAKNQWGYMGGFSWDTADERTNLTMTVHAGPNQISQSSSDGVLPEFTRDPRPDASRLSSRFRRSKQTLLLAGVLTHEWTDRLRSVVEADYGQELNVPILADGDETKNSVWYGGGAWLLYDFTDTLTGVARTTYFRDVNGLRTGYNDSYIESTLGLIWRPRSWFWLRPEVRYDGSWGAPPFNDGNARRQFTFGFDAIFLF